MKLQHYVSANLDSIDSPCPNKGNAKPGRIKTLEFLRFIMLIVIVISHLEFLEGYAYGEIYKTFFHNPTMAVDYFFMLSGFGLMHSNQGKVTVKDISVKNSVTFAISKIKKIYGLYVFSLVISIPYGYFSWHSFRLTELPGIFLSDLTLLQSAFGLTSYSHSLNGVCWFLSTLFILYLFAPILLVAVEKICKSLRLSVILLVVVFSLNIAVYGVMVCIENYTVFDDLSYGSPYYRIFIFIMGMIIEKLVLFHNDYPPNNTSGYEVIISLLCCFWFFFCNSFHNKYNADLLVEAIDVVLCSLLVFIFAINNGKLSRIMEKSNLILLSSLTMYLFLLHYPVRSTIFSIFSDFNIYFGECTGIVMAIISVILSFLFSICIKNLFEGKYRISGHRGNNTARK